ncbi:methyl-accepting chemotaxis protein [Castellaniella sp. MT123]|uniref:methyl-accepting chemotaxis protein n=1 Tax=Castellaniella sp. MT123 TaxID=3140381 RepID=UPI0031F3FC80
MKNLKISTRLAAAFAFLLLLALILASIGIWNARSTQSIAKEIGLRGEANQLITEWSHSVEVRANQVMAYALISDPEMIGYFKQEIDKATQTIESDTQKGQALFTAPESKRLFTEILNQRTQYLQIMNRVFKALDSYQSVLANELVRDQLPAANKSYIASLDALRQYQQNMVNQAQDHSASQARTSENLLILATVLAFILGPLFAWRVMRAITRPLADAVSLAEGIAHNDLSHRVQTESTNEIGQLLHALGRMTQNLRGTVGEVRSGADSIASAANQISAGNLDLSSRTEQQASSLAETAATMEQITATVRQNADNAHQANTLAATAAQTASDGGALVAELVGTMGEIDSKSQQVSDIIGVIDSIAFQTNILALNAAVEAARAGEQGRGFAVVAAEVRALAQRSAGAAKEIKALIDTSVAATTKGNEQAAHAGATMQQIVDSINRVTDIMGEISAASREQTTGIEEINSAITQMDDVTRQNASLVEESAAAATSLQEQAGTLAQLVAIFNLGADAASASPAGSRTASQPPRLPAAPEKVVSPAPQRPRPAAAAARPSAKPALRAPNRPAPVTADTEEWAEF